MPFPRQTLIYILLMTLVVVASNILVQYPLSGTLFGINLGDLLTWGAFTYPIAFLITDLTNRQFGPSAARRVVFAGFVVGVTLSFWTSIPRIAIASGSAYIVGQLLDISVFNRLRRQSWSHWILAHRSYHHYTALLEIIAHGGHKPPTYSESPSSASGGRGGVAEVVGVRRGTGSHDGQRAGAGDRKSVV